jgi:hypothetical protein
MAVREHNFGYNTRMGECTKSSSDIPEFGEMQSVFKKHEPYNILKEEIKWSKKEKSLRI